MKKEELIAAVAERTGETKAATARVIESLQDVIISEVAAGGDVKLTGFVSFEGATRAARTMRNPQNGESIEVAEKRVPRLKPGKRFRDEVGA